MDPQQTQRALDRLVEGIVKLFGSKQPKPEAAKVAEPAVAVEQPPPQPATTQNGDALERILAPFESMPQEMSELRRSLTDVLHNFGYALDHLGIEAKRLSTESSALALMADKLQMRLDDLQRTLTVEYAERPRSAPPSAEAAPPAPSEPQFRPSDQGVGVTLSPVAGFQELMDVQRSLSSLPGAEAASVIGFRNGEASLQLVLRSPVTASEIVEALAQATGEELLIEESRPDAQRLRLRFVEGEGRR
jgi:hypothetical protein